jgi:hypothetical protein
VPLGSRTEARGYNELGKHYVVGYVCYTWCTLEIGKDSVSTTVYSPQVASHFFCHPREELASVLPIKVIRNNDVIAFITTTLKANLRGESFLTQSRDRAGSAVHTL